MKAAAFIIYISLVETYSVLFSEFPTENCYIALFLLTKFAKLLVAVLLVPESEVA